MGGTGVGRVEASNADGIAVGDLVTGPTGWQDYAVLAAKDARVVDADVDPALHLSLFGINGLTAYFGLFDVGQPQPGETVVVERGQRFRRPPRRADGQDPRLPRRRRHRLRRQGRGADRSARLRRRRQPPRPTRSATTSRRRRPTASTSTSTTPAATSSAPACGGCGRTGASCAAASCRSTTLYDPQPGPRGIPGLLVNNRVRMEGFLVFDFADRYDEGRRPDAGRGSTPATSCRCTTRSPASTRRRTRSSTCWPAATSAPASCGSPTDRRRRQVSSSSGRTSRATRTARSSAPRRRRGRPHPW